MTRTDKITITGNKPAPVAAARATGTSMSAFLCFVFIVLFSIPFSVGMASAQGDAHVSARMDARQILVGDQLRFFIQLQHNPSLSRVQWAVIPDTFNSLEVVERGKIDTVKEGDLVTYRQRINITGFDSGTFKIPAFVFPVMPVSGTAYTVQTDSLPLLVQTVPVDTTKGFKGIKGIIYVRSTWRDYIWYIVGGLIFLGLFAFVIIYFVRNKKVKAPKPVGPQETLQEKALRLLSELESKQLWQKKQVKEYYVELTDIVRNYIEQRFRTPAMELTTDELLEKAITNRDMQPFQTILADILRMADLAKFAKAQPLPQEHTDSMAKARLFITSSKPIAPPEPTNPGGGNSGGPSHTAPATAQNNDTEHPNNPGINSEPPIEKNI